MLQVQVIQDLSTENYEKSLKAKCPSESVNNKNSSVDDTGEKLNSLDISTKNNNLWFTCWRPVDGNMLAVGGTQKIVKLFKEGDDDIDSDEGLFKLLNFNKFTLSEVLEEGHTKTVKCAAFSPDGKKLAVGGFDGIITLWADGKCIAQLEGHENEIKSVAWSPNGKLLSSCGRDKTVWIWELNPMDEDPLENEDDLDFECLAVLSEHEQDVKKVKFHPHDSTQLVSCSYDDTLIVWSCDLGGYDDDWLVKKKICDHSSTVWDFDWSEDGKILVSVGDDMRLNVYSVEKLEGGAEGKNECYSLINSVNCAHDRPIYCCSLKTIESTLVLATSSGDRTIAFWKIEDNGESCEKIYTFTSPDRQEINSISWHPHKPILSVCGDNNLFILLAISLEK